MYQYFDFQDLFKDNLNREQAEGICLLWSDIETRISYQIKDLIFLLE